MKLRALALVVAAFASANTMAAMVNVSSNLSLLAIDGQKASKSLLKEKSSFEAAAGQPHQVVVRLTEVIGSGDGQSLFESVPVIVTFDGDSQDLLISTPNVRTKSAGDDFNQAPKITVATKSGEAVNAKIDVLKQEGLFPATKIVEDLSAYNASKAKASVPAFSETVMGAMPLGASGKAAKGKVVVQGENVAEQQLQYWFQQADKETQTRFLNWAKKQK